MTTSKIIISPVTEGDYEQWLLHWQSYQKFYQIQLSDEVTKITWSRFFDPNVPVNCAVAKNGSIILGFVHFVFHLSTWGVSDYCYLEDLFVDSSTRGNHIGKQLIEYVKNQAQARECPRLYWHTQETNKTAQRLYDWVASKPGVIEYRMSL